jgi:hypothetical protein
MDHPDRDPPRQGDEIPRPQARDQARASRVNVTARNGRRNEVDAWVSSSVAEGDLDGRRHWPCLSQ